MKFFGFGKGPVDKQEPETTKVNNSLADLETQIKAETELVPISETTDDDVFVVGYPKSGNTWLQYILAGLVFRMDPEFATDALVQELVPNLHARKYYRRYQKVCFFKSHFLPQASHKRVIYILRDGRDAMVSYYHFLKVLHGDVIEFDKMVSDGTWLFPCKWQEHVEAWLGHAGKTDMLVVKYEDLKRQCVPELKRISQFLNLDCDQEILEFVAQKTAFKKMREREARVGWQDSSAWPKDQFFIRRGDVGSFRDEMPAQVLETFLKEAGPTLEKLGYLTKIAQA